MNNIIKKTLGYVVSLGILLTGILFSAILIYQYYRSPLIFSLALVLCGAMLLMAYFARRLSAKQIVFTLMGVIVVNLVLGVAVILLFKTPLVVEPAYVFDYAAKWVNGPSHSLHALLWTHWGYYGLLLSAWFKVFGTSLWSMKSIGLVSYTILNLSLLILFAKNMKEKAAFYALCIFSLYPLSLTFLNFPTGDLVYVGLLGPVLLLSKKLIEEERLRDYLIATIFFAVILSIQNLFKDTAVVFLPIFTFISAFYFFEKRHYYRIIITPLLLVLVMWASSYIAAGYLGSYAVGPTNSSKTGYFLATGTNYDTKGMFNSHYYYDEYWGPINKLYAKGQLTKKVFVERNKYFMNLAVENVKSLGTNGIRLGTLFFEKVTSVWLSDKPIIRQTSFDDNGQSGYKYTQMQRYADVFYVVSDVFYYAIIFFFVVDCFWVFREEEKDYVNVLSVFMVVGMFFAFSVMEGQPRYRFILMPFMILAASYGVSIVSKKINIYLERRRSVEI